MILPKDDVYKTIELKSDGFYSEKGSKFYSFIYPIENEQHVKEHLAELKKEYHDASHYVYAFMLGYDKKNFRCSDDGEPANSSGAPILGQIRSFDITNVIIIVVRYFGGTKLGVSGLINAYKTAAIDAISKANIIKKTINVNFEIICNYDNLSFVQNLVKKFNGKIVSQKFLNNCSIVIEIRKSLSENFLKEISLSQIKNNILVKF